MKKTVYIIILSIFSVLFLISCGEKKTERKEKDKKEKTTIEVETEEATTVPVITVENITTTTKPIQTTAQAKKLNLNNKLEGSYSLKSIEFSVPAYLDTKSEKDNSVTIVGTNIATFLLEGHDECSEQTYKSLVNSGTMETYVIDYFTNSNDKNELEKIKTEKISASDTLYEYWVYKWKTDKDISSLYFTWIYDNNNEALYLLMFRCNASYEYDFESDFVNILKSIKTTEYHKEEQDIIQINRSFLSTDWSGNTVLVVEYTWKNTNDKTKSFMWDISTTCFQNGVECDTAYFCDDVDSGDSMKDVMPGYSLTVRKAYEIKDMSDVTIMCSKYLSSDTLLETTIKLS